MKILCNPNETPTIITEVQLSAAFGNKLLLTTNKGPSHPYENNHNYLGADMISLPLQSNLIRWYYSKYSDEETEAQTD